MTSLPEPTSSTAADTLPSRRWRGARGLRLIAKEEREILSDRRTLFTLFIMPVLIYPLLAIGFREYFLVHANPSEGREFRIGFLSEQEGRWLWGYMGFSFDEWVPTDGSAPDLSGAENTDAKHRLSTFIAEDLEAVVRDGDVDVGIRVHDIVNPEQNPREPLAARCEILYRENSPRSEAARDFLESSLARANAEFLSVRLAMLKVPQRAVAVRPEPRAIPSETAPETPLALVIPFALLLMTVTGAVYPAIDLTAGERERGTLEVLIAAPVPRAKLLLAKYVAVLTVATITASINVVSMAITLRATGLWPMLFGEQGLRFTTLAAIGFLVVLFAAFFSAMLLCVTSVARSFKEAQAYLVPIMVVSMVPGLASLLPGTDLQGALAIVPLLNIVLLGRDLLTSHVEPVVMAVVLVSTLLYAWAAIALAARIFGDEAVLYSTNTGWFDVFRRPRHAHVDPSLASAASLLAVVFAAHFFLSGLVMLEDQWPMPARLAAGGAVTILVFLALPVLAVWWHRIDWRTIFRIRPARAAAWIGAVLVALSMWPWAHELVVLLHETGVVSIDTGHFEQIQALLDQWRMLPISFVILVMAVVPAVCEEWFFRGYVLGVFSRSMSARAAILTSSLLFGLFHVVTPSSLALERFLPSTVIGCVLGLVCWRTGSLFPGMLAHAAHNGLLIGMAYYQPQMERLWGWALEERSHLPPVWLAASGLLLILGLGIVIFAGKTMPREQAASVSTEVEHASND